MSKIIIIGSGMGGLTAGCLLSRKGHTVTLFESHSMPGGYVGGFQRNGFYFESGTLSFESSAQVFAVMKLLGIYDRVRFVPQPMRFLAPQYDFVPGNYGDFKQKIMAAFPADKAGLTRFFTALDPIYGAMHNVLGGKNVVAKATGGIGMALQYLKYRNTTITDFTARFFDRQNILFRIFKGFGYPDMSAWLLGGAMVTIFHDYWTVQDGMQVWADILADTFKSSGGELLLKTGVEKITTKNGSAAGVVAGGREYAADWVISACDYKQTFLALLDNRSLVPDTLMEKIQRTAVSEGIVTVYCGLDLTNEELKTHMKIPHAAFFDEQPGFNIKDSRDPHFFEKTSISLYSPSLHSSRLAPEGKSSLMIQATAPYRWQDNWGGGDREKYLQLKTQVRQALLDKAAKVIPGLERHCTFVDAATPLTYERYTGNSDGATSAWSWNPKNKFYSSIMKVHVQTPVKGLLIGSCWATQIGGVPGALNAAQACAKLIT